VKRLMSWKQRNSW